MSVLIDEAVPAVEQQHKSLRIIVVYYSRTGVTRRCAEQVAAALYCDCVEIRDQREREGFAGGVGGFLEALGEGYTEIEVPPLDFGSYDAVVIGSPVWGFSPAPAIRTFLSDRGGDFKAIGLFATVSLLGGRRALRKMQEICGADALATLALTEAQVAGPTGKDAAERFAARIRGHAG